MEEKNTSDPVYVIARLNDRDQPLDRGELYENPLDEILKQAGVGSVICMGELISRNEATTR